MIGKLLKLSWRNLRRNLLYSAIVIAGLSLGITTFLTITQWSAWHLSFDKHFENSENIYRLSLLEKSENFERHTARIIHGDAVQQIYNDSEIPEIEKIGRLSPFRNAIVRKDELVYYEDRCFSCDPEFLELFPPKLIVGGGKDLFLNPGEVLLSEETAKRYFGEENPIGQLLEIVHQFASSPESYEVKGIFKAYPSNSHFKIDILTSRQNIAEYNGTAWVYIQIAPSSDLRKIKKEIKDFLVENNEEDYSEGVYPYLTALEDIHLKSHLPREIEQNVEFQTLIVLFIAGLLVLILAWFNFTLLTISQNQLNLKKLIFQWQMGADRKSFFIQFLVDFSLIGIISFLLAIFISILISPFIANVLGIALDQNLSLLVGSILAVLIVILLSAFLTALFAMRRLYRAIRLKYFARPGSGNSVFQQGNWFIRGIILVEFIITFILLSNLAVIRLQVLHSNEIQLGANDTTTIQIPNLPRPIINKYNVFKEEISKYPVFDEVTAMMEEPSGMAMDAFNARIEGLENSNQNLFLFPVDENFIRFYDLNILAGKDFPEKYNTEDTTEYFALNESAARLFFPNDYSNLIGRKLTLDFPYKGFIYPGDIVAVIEDFHISSMTETVNPMLIFPEYTWLYCFSIRISGKSSDAVKNLREVWANLFPEYPLQYYFTADLYKNLYEAEYTQIKVLMIFSFLSIIIACTGLFALSGFFMQHKMHASAIRKINGARVGQILLPELLQYIYLALMSLIVSIPVSIFTNRKWLNNFVYQAEIPLWLYPAIALLLILFSWIAVSYHSYRLAKLNPTDFIRGE